MGDPGIRHKWYDVARQMKKFAEFIPNIIPFVISVISIVLAILFKPLFVSSHSIVLAYVAVYFFITACAAVVAYQWGGGNELLFKRPSIFRFFRAALFVYAVFLVYRAWIGYRNYLPYIDLAYYESAVYQFSHFQLAKIWDVGSPLWSQHFEPVLFLFVPWYWIGLGGSQLLVIGQALAAVCGAMPLYVIARKRLSGSIALGLAVCLMYLTFGGLQSAYFYGFHPIALFPFFFLMAVMWYERKNYLWYSIFLLMSLFVKEEISFVAVVWGVWMVVGRKDLRRGVGTILAGIVWYFISFQIIAYFRHGGYEYWGQFGGGAQGGVFGIIRYALMHPVAFVGQFFNNDRKLPMLIEVFGSFGFLPFFAPLSLVILVPSLLLKLLSNDIAMMDSFHYSAEITPLLALSMIEGARVLLQKKWVVSYIAPYIFCVAVLSNIYYGFPYFYQVYAARFDAFSASDIFITSHSHDVDSFLSKIPKNAAVSCEYALCPHIERLYGGKWSAPSGPILDYVVFDASLPLTLTDQQTTLKYFNTKVAPYYALIAQNDGLWLFKKK